MRKKSIAAVMLSLIILFLALGYGVYRASEDNFNNIRQGYENIYAYGDKMEFINWEVGENGEIISQADPSIIIRDINTYIHSLKINGEFKVEGKIKLYYTENAGEDFTEDKAMECEYKVVNGYPVVYIDKKIKDLRIDLTEEAGLKAKIFGAEINDRSPVWSPEILIAKGLFPGVVLITILILAMFFNNIKSYFQVFKKYTALLNNLVTRDLKVKYRRSVLGFLWSVLNPLLMAFIINAVFSHLFRFTVEYFIIYYLLGSVMFNFMTEATSGAMTSVIGAGALIKKVYIPKYVFPMEKCIFAFINMIFSLVAVIIMIAVVGMPVNGNALLFFVPMIYVAVFSLGLGLILATITVFFRDVEHLYSVLVSAWIYLTPVIYPEDILSDQLKNLMRFNPMYHYVTYFRSVIMQGVVPDLNTNLVCMAFSIGMLILGLFVFKKFQDKFVLYI